MKKLLLFLIMTGVLLAAQPELSLSVNDAHYYIGDRIKINMKVVGDEQQLFMFPDFNEYLKNVLILDVQKKESVKKHKKITDMQIEITGFDTGFVHIPSMPVIATDSTGFGKPDTLFSPEKYVYIYSILDSSAAPVAIDPPVPLSLLTWWEALVAVVLLAGSIFLLIFGIKHRSRKSAQVEEVWQSPKEKAEHYLKELEDKHYPEHGQWKKFYLELTYIARDFFENIYFVHLKELTTTDLIPELKEHVPAQYQNRLRDFFQFADLVKFAKGLADKEQCDDHYKLIKEFVETEDKTEDVVNNEEGDMAQGN